MDRRLEFQTLLTEILGTKDELESRVYFQPPETIKMEYPCIVYKRSTINTIFANNIPYVTNTRYQVTVIDKDPDSNLPNKIGRLPTAKLDRHFTFNNLNHDVYNIYY